MWFKSAAQNRYNARSQGTGQGEHATAASNSLVQPVPPSPRIRPPSCNHPHAASLRRGRNDAVYLSST